jgi:hypothetical protein
MVKYMYIVYTKWASLDYSKWDWEPMLKQWRGLMEEYGIQLIGRGYPAGMYDDWVAVYLSDIEPTIFSEFLTKSMTFNGKRVGRTSTTVVVSQD